MDMLDWVRSATLAPSIHNSQPWRFRVRPDGGDVYGDERRPVDVMDSDGRQVHHSAQTNGLTCAEQGRCATRMDTRR